MKKEREGVDSELVWRAVGVFPSYDHNLPVHEGSQVVTQVPEVGGYRDLDFSISPSNEYSGLISFRID